MILYADVLFAVNFIMDFFCLYTARRVLRLPKGTARCVSAALIGALYGTLCAFFTPARPFGAVAVSFLLCAIAVWNGRMLTLVKGIAVFYGVSMLCGGALTFLYQKAYAWQTAPLFRNGLSAPLFFAFAGLMFVLLAVLGRLFRASRTAEAVSVSVRFGSKSGTLHLLCDSGNLLRDPYNGRPVIVLAASCLDALLGTDGFHRKPLIHTAEAVARHFHYIPIRTASGEGVLGAFCADELTIYGAHVQTALDAMLAVDENGSYGEYDGIVSLAAVSEAA